MKTGIQGGLGENGRLSKRARDGSASIISGVALWSFLAVEYSTLVTAVTIHRGSVILMTGRRIMRRMSSVAYVDTKRRWVSVTIKSQQWWILQISSWKDEDMNISNRAYHLECTALSVFHTLLEDIFALVVTNCFLSVSFSLFLWNLDQWRKPELQWLRRTNVSVFLFHMQTFYRGGKEPISLR